MCPPALGESGKFIAVGNLVSAHPCRGQHPSEGWVLALGGGGASLICPSLNPIDTPVTGLGISSVANSEGK